MNLKLLIDGIVRQTTVLLAQLSTASGVRSPLAHVADQVFLELASEIEAQGVRRQVVADMFGMALRSYQKKMQRLTESASVRQLTLWEAVLGLVEQEQPTRARVIERFRHDGEREVAAVLADLVRSGILFVTGSGDGALYGLTSEAMRDRIQEQHDFEAVVNLAWMKVFRREAVTRDELIASLPVDRLVVERAIEELLSSGRLEQVDAELRSGNMVLPLGGDQGWEAAVLDHFRAVATAVASKVRAGATGSRVSDNVGGSTFTFTVGAGHPLDEAVCDLFRRTRLEAQALWDRVAAFNVAHPPAADQASRVTFYVGQSVEQSEPEAAPVATGDQQNDKDEKSGV
jgi:hypothetical protein